MDKSYFSLIRFIFFNSNKLEKYWHPFVNSNHNFLLQREVSCQLDEMGIKWCCPKELNLRLSSRWNALPTELETTQNLEGNVGFEPTEPFSPTVFKTAALDHYANSPCMEEGTGIEPETFQPEMFTNIRQNHSALPSSKFGAALR